MLFYDYKGYTIYAAPRLVAGSGRWKIELTLRHHALASDYSYDEDFNSEGEAVFNCIKYGKQLIDEGIELLEEVI